MKKHKLELTEKEFIALINLLDTYSSISDGIEDDGEAKDELKTVDEMLKRNGYKRVYN